MEYSLKAVEPRRLYKEAVNRIQDLIRDRNLQPGDRLPPERDLAEQLQVSRSSLREATRSLELQGVVAIRPGAGTFVCDPGVVPLNDALVAYLTNGSDALFDVFEMRHILEPQIAALAARRCTADDIQQMEDLLEAQRLEIERGESGARGDTAFHFAIAEVSQNSALVKVVTAVSDILGQSREDPFQTPGRPNRSLSSHRYILDMLRIGDSEGAREAMEHHISVVEPIYPPGTSARIHGGVLEPTKFVREVRD